ncbi:hypothetical protein ACF0H5_017693 [Mactra antiquata]
MAVDYKIGLLVFVAALEVVVNQEAGCPAGFELHDTTCFFFSSGEHTWIEAFKFCRTFGYQLVEVQDAQKDAYIRNKTSSLGGYFWISLSDKYIEGEFRWESTKTMLTSTSYQNWGVGEPDPGNENCVFYAPSRNYTWADASCTRSEKYICEKSADLGPSIG